MHELSLIQSVLDIIEQHAQQHQFNRVLSVKLSFGRLSSVEPAALKFAFEVQAQGTRSEGASLDFDIIPAGIYCFSCQQDITLDRYTATCPQCNGAEITLTAGTDELKLLEMEVE